MNATIAPAKPATKSLSPTVRDQRSVSLSSPANQGELNGACTVAEVLGQVALIQQIMSATMKDGEHYGRIPGCGDKPTLLKPGAEKLCLTFRMAPFYDVIEVNLDRGHREYRVTCELVAVLTGAKLGQGVGYCSSTESKYRFRQGNAEPTDNPVPRAYWDLRGEDPAKAQELIGGKGFSVKKVEGKGWMIAKGGEKVETDNPSDSFNTVLKMAKKRALVDAVLTATAASDIFTQDLEDISANMARIAPPAAAPAANGGVGTIIEAEEVSSSALPAPLPAAAPVAATKETPWGDVRVHFGKNRGLMLSELSPQQLHWYVTDWMPKKEANGGGESREDAALIAACKAVPQDRLPKQPAARR